MKKIPGLLIVLGLFFYVGCKGNSDVLVDFKDGKITRGEFYDWLKSKRAKIEDVLKNKKTQESQLNKMATEKIVVSDAKKNSFQNDERLKLIINFAGSNNLVREYIVNKVEKNDDIKKPLIRISHILLQAKPKAVAKKGEEEKINQEFEKNLDSVKNKAKDIIAKLDKGEKFEDLAKKYSQDSSKNTKGDRGYMLEGMLDNEYNKIAFSLKKGEYTKEPVVVKNKVYIIKVTEKDDIDIDDVESKIEKKIDQNKILRFFKRTLFNEHLENLKKMKDVKYSGEVISGNDENAVIFTIGTEKFTVKDMNGVLNLLMGPGPDGKPVEMPLPRKEGFAKKFFEMKLLEREAKRVNFDKSDEYLATLTFFEDSVIYREYMRKISLEDVSVSDKEMKEEYSKNKDKSYYEMKPVGKGKKQKRVKKILPYSKVKERIKMMLTSRKRSKRVRDWKDKLIKAQSIKIKTEKLEGK